MKLTDFGISRKAEGNTYKSKSATFAVQFISFLPHSKKKKKKSKKFIFSLFK